MLDTANDLTALVLLVAVARLGSMLGWLRGASLTLAVGSKEERTGVSQGHRAKAEKYR
jgi:hypothetical protein